MYRQIGGHDEEFLTVGGYTILQDGVPRIPYTPVRDPTNAYYRADEAVFAYPPAYYYWLAAWYLVLGPSCFAAQWSSAMAGVLAIVVLFSIGRRLFGDDRAALAGVGLYSVSRTFYLPAMHARPDMLCALFALAAMRCCLEWHIDRRPRRLALASLLAGWSFLAHPFGAVACLQVGGWALLAARGWRERLRMASLSAACGALAVACWLPLVVQYPDHTRQFYNNVIHRRGTGLGVQEEEGGMRALAPWEAWAAQSRNFLEHNGWPQTLLAGAGAAIATIWDWRRRSAQGDVSHRAPIAVWLTWSSALLLASIQGSHPLQSYWCYPGAFIWLLSGRAVQLAYDAIRQRLSLRSGRLLPFGTALLLGLVMAPGSGLRALAVHVRHFDDPAYSRPRFTGELLDGLPIGPVYLVDPEWAFDFYLAGHQVLLMWYQEGRHYDYVVVGPSNLHGNPPRHKGKLVKKLGIADNPFACYAEVYESGLPPPPLDAGAQGLP